MLVFDYWVCDGVRVCCCVIWMGKMIGMVVVCDLFVFVIWCDVFVFNDLNMIFCFLVLVCCVLV